MFELLFLLQEVKTLAPQIRVAASTHNIDLFIAIIIPQARKNKVVACLIVICFAASWCADRLAFLQSISSGTKTIILTIVIASVAAILFPVDKNPNVPADSAGEVRDV